MARDGESVDPRLAGAVAAFADGQPMVVSARCAELGISRATFYKYVARFKKRGVEGLFPDSRRPRRSPGKLPTDLEDVLIRIRKQEADAGWDYGADAVLLRLEEQQADGPGLWPANRPFPSRATINRVFDARGQLEKVPQRRPRRIYRRFAREAVNELWQFDGFDYPLADGTTATVLHLNDDCSRVDLALRAAVSENGIDVWATFCHAVADHQALPAAVLTDNGSAFSTRARGSTNQFEARLTALHIKAITARIEHPQTCGKNERAHQRVLKWLDRQTRPATIESLQHLLDHYRDQFNNRRNLVLDKLTPNERYALGPFASPDPSYNGKVAVTQHTVGSEGRITVNNAIIGLGRRYHGHPATAFRQGDHLTVFIDGDLARELIIDHSRRYQPQDH
jgi:winged helix-turn helix protein